MRFPSQITNHEETTNLINEWRYKQIQSPLKVQSVKQYISSYNRISEHMNAKDDDDVYFLNRFDDVIKAMETIPSRVGKITDSTKRNYISGLYQMGLVCEIDINILHKYSQLRDDMNKKQDKIIKKSEFTEKEMNLLNRLNYTVTAGENLSTTQWMYNILDNMAQDKESAVYKFCSQKDYYISEEKDKQQVGWFMTMRILMDHRFRNDLCSVFMTEHFVFAEETEGILTQEYAEQQVEDSYEEGNWLVKRKTGWHIILNDHKTKQEQTEKINLKLIDGPEPGINFYLDLYYDYKKTYKDAEGKVPFINKANNVDELMDTKRFSEFIMKNNEKYLGSPIGTKLLRKMFYTDKYQGIISDIKKDAEQNLHSVGTALNHYAKNHSKGHYTNQM